ncbi:MAG: ParM/StbA family protein, partial [Actinomycetia bacterium]|nr:ParM/StbA family protein [Actinomycetes bacterium]
IATRRKRQETRRQMTDANDSEPINVGLDDGYACTKIALPDGRLVAIPSRARVGRANVTWLNEARHKIAEYETEDTLYAVGEIDGEPTYFDGYPFSGLNRVIVQHGMQQAKLGGHSIHAVSGLPVSAFYLKDGSQRAETVEKKRASLKQPVDPIDGRLAASVAFHEVIPEALAAWYDYVITDSGGQVTLAEERLGAPIAVVDIGGRTTDYVVVADQAVVHDASGSLRCGLLDVKKQVGEGIRAKYDLEVVGERTVEQAVQKGTVRLYGRDQDVSVLVREAKQ